MLRHKLRNLFEIADYRNKLSKVLRILAVVGIFWIFAFPYSA